tara:strand:+ start:39 stop:566 length:528 start_codon:yes stop_codon:yes gene_type:complete
MELMDPDKQKKVKQLIYLLSIVIPVVVAILFGAPKVKGIDTSFLPPIYATINGITALSLLGALIAVKNKNIELHRKFIRFALLLSILFLGCYVAYHLTSESTSYGGSLRTIYFTLLISHISLSIIVIPLVLFTYLFAWQGDFERHKKWTRFTWPIWFYVALSGVVVFWMISPFYK